MDTSNLNDGSCEPRVYHFLIYGAFDAKLLANFLDFLNRIEKEDHVEITMTSQGGELSIQYPFIRLINQNPDKFTLILSESADSAALDLILTTDCKKVFLPSFTGGIMHNSWNNVNTNELLDKNSECSQKLSLLNKLNTKLITYYRSLGIKEEKLKRVSTGEDVFLSPAEITKAIKIKEKEGIKFKMN
jgi:ATP-dependent protease ClpP protease subunit